MTSDLLERLDFWRDTANLRSREIIRLNAEVERLNGELVKEKAEVERLRKFGLEFIHACVKADTASKENTK